MHNESSPVSQVLKNPGVVQNSGMTLMTPLNTQSLNFVAPQEFLLILCWFPLGESVCVCARVHGQSFPLHFCSVSLRKHPAICRRFCCHRICKPSSFWLSCGSAGHVVAISNFFQSKINAERTCTVAELSLTFWKENVCVAWLFPSLNPTVHSQNKENQKPSRHRTAGSCRWPNGCSSEPDNPGTSYPPSHV